ncbi:unnamed protein product [Owenia fusiformis]|uniref:DUF4549 domain-containing protein n=1 Tax=Owenia fusiformis TaxID=6347 RepID=A0A8S4NTE4_OWEFU|nr:unnamed protein product [Owenia fusiformis]
MDSIYRLSNSERVKDGESELIRDLAELKNELEENEMIHQVTPKSTSSIPIPKDAEHFKRERRLIFERALEVSEAQPLVVQAQTMKTELENGEKLEYTPQSLPLLLHQHFIDRMHQLVQCKHMHMLRWKRFNEHTSTIEALYPLYQDRLAHIMSEYNDATQRAERLSVAKESVLAGNENAAQAMKLDDMMIYLRWLVCHFNATKRFNQFMKTMQWLTITHKFDIVPERKEQSPDDDFSTQTKIPSRYNEDENHVSAAPKSASSRPTSARSRPSIAAVAPPMAPVLNPTLHTTVPMSASQFAYAAAASGGGIASDEHSSTLPLHYNEFDHLKPHLSFFVNIYGVGIDTDAILTSGDEMELYGAVNRKFKQVYVRQEQMKTFKTYDKAELGSENWGSDHSTHALKQESNWLPFLTLKAERDPNQEKKMTQLRQNGKVDELLRCQSKFLQLQDSERVQNALKDHAIAVRDPPSTQPVSVTSNKTSYHTGQIWKKIYSNPELYADKDSDGNPEAFDFDEKDADNVNFGKRVKSGRKRRDSYDYHEVVQTLGLDDGENDSNDPSSIQGAYLSFLMLRHLRIRDLQRTCLSIINYFRSVERTLTINDGGLSLESGNLKRVSHQNHRKSTIHEGGLGGGGGLGSHLYMHNTPRDYKISEVEFMEFSEVENHDDFYTTDEGRVHVQDQRGYYIMYDSATDELKKLEHDLLLIATTYIEKDKDMRTASGIQRTPNSRRRNHQTGGFDISSYGHQEIDRFAVLLDLWTQEAAYLECKKYLLDCYLEAYHHVFDRDEKRGLAQVITNVMAKRPRLDFQESYFVKSYRMECICLRQHAHLVKSILDKQIEDQREYIQKVTRDGDKEFGLPHKIVPKQLISINMSRSALRNVYMLEFHPSLAFASKIPDALNYAFWELYHVHKPETTTEIISLERKLLEFAYNAWEQQQPMGTSYSQQTQKDLFSDVFVEDPLFICEIAGTLVHKYEQNPVRKSQREKHTGMIQVVATLMEAINLRQRLIDASWETEILSKIYRRQAIELSFDDCHLFLRFVQFEFAAMKENAGKPPPLFITAVQEDDSNVDRYVPTYLYLAVHELDENHVGRFSFRSRDGVLQVCKAGSFASLQVVLQCQVVHKNSLTAAVLLANACQPAKQAQLELKGIKGDADTKSEKSSLTAMTGFSSGTKGTEFANKMQAAKHKSKCSSEAFVSLQLEKGPKRDLMLNEFVRKKESMATVLRNPEEMEKLKRKLIQEYCYDFNQRISQYSLRAQIISYYAGITTLLDQFPNIRDTYFVFGEANEKKSNSDSLEGLKLDCRTLKKRPRRVISKDGQHVLNIWFIPHHSENLITFKEFEDEALCHRALYNHLVIVSALHDIAQYLCAHARMGSSHARLGTRKLEFVSADWGGTEGIGSEFREIQKQINNLEEPTNVESVGQFLTMRRDIMFLEFDSAVRHSMRDTFLATGNVSAYNAITNNIHFALPGLSNIQRPSIMSTYLNVPEPLEARDFKAQELYPWRSFIGRNGPYPTMFWQWFMIDYYLQMCLAGTKEVDRHVANGEILGVTLLMEDVLQSGNPDFVAMGAVTNDNEEDEGGSKTLSPSRPATRLSSRAASSMSLQGEKKTGPMKPKPLSRLNQPIESYKLLKFFLLLWKRLELFKTHWGCRKLNTEKINNSVSYKAYCKIYKVEKLFPVLQSIARRHGQGELYDGMTADTEPLVSPKGATEIEIRSKQLISLLESEECYMIVEVRKKLAKELSLALAERAREEGALPTDLWKKSAVKESFTIAKPHIAEDFVDQLFENQERDQKEVTFKTSHLNECLRNLGQSIMARERHNYDSYSMYYENLLRQHHQLLYQKEQEIKQLNDQIKQQKESTDIEVKCQMADENYDILLEITALRAKVLEMREMAMSQEKDLRDRVQEEYDELVLNLFSSAFELKTKFDEFKDYLHDDVYDKIQETRREAIEEMTRVKLKAIDGSEEAEFTKRNMAQSEKLANLQHDNFELTKIMHNMQIFNKWKFNWKHMMSHKEKSQLGKNSDRSKKDYLEVKMLADEEVILLRQQIVALRAGLSQSEAECNQVKKQLEKELKENREKAHSLMQKAQSQRQLELAKQANMERMIGELEDKELRLRIISSTKDKNLKMQQIENEKAVKDMFHLKKKLTHERSLKLDAFQRVDDLQTQVYDVDAGISPPSRPHTAAPSLDSRSVSPTKRRGPSRSTDKNSGIWPPPVEWPANRRMTSMGISMDFTEPKSPPLNNNESRKIQRPKTVTGRLRSRIAEQLLNELEPPDHHETILKLRELSMVEKKQF